MNRRTWGGRRARSVLCLSLTQEAAVAAEDVEHHIQVEVGPLRRPEQLRDVPAPKLVGALRQQLRGGVAPMPELIAPLPHLGVLGQEPIHCPLRAEIRALVEQGGVNLPPARGPRLRQATPSPPRAQRTARFPRSGDVRDGRSESTGRRATQRYALCLRDRLAEGRDCHAGVG
jgi:hypothetical protein